MLVLVLVAAREAPKRVWLRGKTVSGDHVALRLRGCGIYH